MQHFRLIHVFVLIWNHIWLFHYYILLGLQYNGGIIEDYQFFCITSFQGDPRMRGQREDHGDIDGEQSWHTAGFRHQQCRDGQRAGE